MYLAEVQVIEHIHVDADNMEDAFEKAAQEVADLYDTDVAQVNVAFVKEVK